MVEKRFKLKEYFPKEWFEKITEFRVSQCKFPLELQKYARERKRRENLTRDGKLTILAADHPARMVTNIGDDSMALGNRYEFLGRIRRVLSLPEWDGVMATTDVLEDLLILDIFDKERGGLGMLDGKVMIGCMNRGGLKKAIFEMDDYFTSFTAKSIKALGLDGAKLMFRLTFPQAVPECGRTIEYCAKAINQLNRYNIPVFLECLPVEDVNYKTIKKAEELIKVIGVATALGDSSRNIWLKIPYCKEFKKVVLATTCPILVLGGEAKGDISPVLKEISQALRAGKNVRGVLMGRNILFPGDMDPREAASKVVAIVHGGRS